MRRVLLALLAASVMLCPACTTLQPTEASPQEIRRLILSDGLLEPGQRVRLVTADEVAHEFRITNIDIEQGIVHGEDAAVRVDSIVAVETREVSVGRTALLTGGLVYGIGLIIAIAIAPALILSGG